MDSHKLKTEDVSPLFEGHGACQRITDHPIPCVFDSLRVPALVVTEDGRIATANPAALHCMGLRLKQLVGRNVSEFLEDLPSLLKAVESKYSTGCHATFMLKRPGLDEIPVEIVLNAMFTRNGQPHRLYTLQFEDISEELQLRAERNRLLQLATVSEIMPSILHELKNPLAAVSTMLEVILEDLGQGELREDLYACLGEVRRMKLSLEGIGVAGRDLNILGDHKTAADHVSAEAARILEPKIEERGVSLVLDIPDLPLLPLDPAVLRALVFNLLMNAMHASDRGGTITLRLRLNEDNSRFTLAVQDTGCGMSPEVLTRCRQMFYTTKRKGSGIGLALCDGIAKEAKGMLHIDSTEGQGTTVTLSIPLAYQKPTRVRRMPNTPPSFPDW